VGTVVVKDGRVTSVNYVPSRNTPRYRQYERRTRELEEMKAFAAVASRTGRFVVDDLDVPMLANRIRQAKGIDPTMGLYAAYAYAQAGRYEDVYSVYRYMRDDEIELPVPFDVLMLATRLKPDASKDPRARFAPFAPMLSQGWALLIPGDPMHKEIHQKLRPHLTPSLWTTLDVSGVRLVRRAIRSGTVQ
jgi:pentatricopeptide repeat protein